MEERTAFRPTTAVAEHCLAPPHSASATLLHVKDPDEEDIRGENGTGKRRKAASHEEVTVPVRVAFGGPGRTKLLRSGQFELTLPSLYTLTFSARW